MRFQQRLDRPQVEALVADYASGLPVRDLTDKYGIHKNTVMEHLRREYTGKRRRERQMTPEDVRRAAALYSTGLSLATLANSFGLASTTIRRELLGAGVVLRPRRGWPAAYIENSA